jgi:hypothetical protein
VQCREIGRFELSIQRLDGRASDVQRVIRTPGISALAFPKLNGTTSRISRNAEFAVRKAPSASPVRSALALDSNVAK